MHRAQIERPDRFGLQFTTDNVDRLLSLSGASISEFDQVCRVHAAKFQLNLNKAQTSILLSQSDLTKARLCSSLAGASQHRRSLGPLGEGFPLWMPPEGLVTLSGPDQSLEVRVLLARRHRHAPIPRAALEQLAVDGVPAILVELASGWYLPPKLANELEHHELKQIRDVFWRQGRRADPTSRTGTFEELESLIHASPVSSYVHRAMGLSFAAYWLESPDELECATTLLGDGWEKSPSELLEAARKLAG